MKVKISYTIDTEQIPNKIKQIIRDKEHSLKRLTELSSGLQQGDHGINSLKHLSDMKELAVDLAEVYSDCESILSGFLKAMTTDTNKEVENDGET